MTAHDPNFRQQLDRLIDPIQRPPAQLAQIPPTPGFASAAFAPKTAPAQASEHPGVGREIGAGIVQFSLVLLIAVPVAAVACVFILRMMSLADAEQMNHNAVKRWTRNAELSAIRVQNEQAKITGRLVDRQVQALCAKLQNEKTAGQVRGTTERLNREMDPLVAQFRRRAHAVNASNVLTLLRIPAGDRRRSALSEALIEHLKTGRVPAAHYGLVASRWPDKPLATAVLDYYHRGGARAAGDLDFQTLWGFVAWLDDVRVWDFILRFTPRLDEKNLSVYGAVFALYAPADSPHYRSYFEQDSPSGVLVREALLHNHDWPDDLREKVTSLLSPPLDSTNGLLLDWLATHTLPPQVCEHLFPSAVKQLAASKDTRDLRLVRIVANLTTAATAPKAVAAAEQLESANPPAARRLVLLLLSQYPSETMTALAHAVGRGHMKYRRGVDSTDPAQPAEAQKDAVVDFADRTTSRRIDAAVAEALVEFVDREPPKNWRQTALQWGGPISSHLLDNRQYTPTISTR